MRWSKSDFNSLRELYSSKISLKEISSKLNRSVKSISHKAVRLRLFRPNIPINRPKSPSHRAENEKRYYEKNKKLIYIKKKKRANNRKLEMILLLGGKCNICGYNRCAAALDFHHKSDDKDEDVARLIKDASKQQVLKEVNKCILLCANCHRETHSGTYVNGRHTASNTLKT